MIWKRLSTAVADDDPWFRPNLRTKKYEDFGDAYSDDSYNKTSGVSPGWNVEPTWVDTWLRLRSQGWLMDLA